MRSLDPDIPNWVEMQSCRRISLIRFASMSVWVLDPKLKDQIPISCLLKRLVGYFGGHIHVKHRYVSSGSTRRRVCGGAT